jgi:uncharacterized integral membrane protein
MVKWKIVVVALLSLLFLVVIVQNTDPVETKFLMASFTMPSAALLFLAGLVGFVIGLLTALKLSGKKTLASKV